MTGKLKGEDMAYDNVDFPLADGEVLLVIDEHPLEGEQLLVARGRHWAFHLENMCVKITKLLK